MKCEWTIAAVASLVMGSLALGQASWEVVSPSDQVSLRLSLTTPGRAADYPADQRRLYYEVSWQGQRILAQSPLGIVCSDAVRRSSDDALTGTLQTGDFVDGLTFVSSTGTETIDESYTMPHGKSSNGQKRFREKIVTFKNADGALIQIVLRACDEGVAFRYQFPAGAGGDAKSCVSTEATGFRLPEGGKVWVHPYDEPGKYTPAYETYWSNGVNVGTASRARAGGRFRCCSARRIVPIGD